MSLKGQPQAKEATSGSGKKRWRKKIAFWKGEKVDNNATEITPRWSVDVDDASFEIASIATPNPSEVGFGSPHKSEGMSVGTSNPSVMSAPERKGAVEKSRPALPKIPIIAEKEWAGLPSGNFDLKPRSWNESEISSLYKEGSTLQGSNMSMESREKSLGRWNSNSVASDNGSASAAYAAATQAIQQGNAVDQQKSTIVSEALSSKVELLHGVHMESEQENLSIACQSTCASLQHCDPTGPSAAVLETSSLTRNQDPVPAPATPPSPPPPSPSHNKNGDSSRCISEESVLMYHRRRLEEIQKEIDALTFPTDEERTILFDDEDEEDDLMIKEDYPVAETITDNLIDKIVYFFTCSPRLSLFSLPFSRDENNDDVDDGTFLEGGDTEGSSNTGDQTMSTYDNDGGHDDDQEQTDDGSYSYVTRSLATYDDIGNDTDDGTESENSLLKSRYHFEDEPRHRGTTIRRDDSSSLEGSFMDQSHIYLMMTNARQERVANPSNELPKSGEYFVAWNEKSKETSKLQVAQLPGLSTAQPRERPSPLTTSDPTSPFAWLLGGQRQSQHETAQEISQEVMIDSDQLTPIASDKLLQPQLSSNDQQQQQHQSSSASMVNASDPATTMTWLTGMHPYMQSSSENQQQRSPASTAQASDPSSLLMQPTDKHPQQQPSPDDPPQQSSANTTKDIELATSLTLHAGGEHYPQEPSIEQTNASPTEAMNVLDHEPAFAWLTGKQPQRQTPPIEQPRAGSATITKPSEHETSFAWFGTQQQAQDPPIEQQKETSRETESRDRAISFEWLKHLQRQIYPTDSHQLDSVGNHDRWLRCVQQAIRDGSVGSSSTLEERLVAAKDALIRLQQESEKKESTEDKGLKFALWL